MNARQRTRLALLRLVGKALAARGQPDSAGALSRPATDAPRILLIRPDHVGDVLLAGPAGRLLAAQLPAARIDWLVGSWADEVVRRSGHAGDVLACDFPGFTRRPKGSPWAPYATLLAVARRLRARAYDGAVILRPDHWWGALLAATAGIPVRVGYSVPECAPFLTDMLPIPHGVHAVEANLALARHAALALGAVASPAPSAAEPRTYAPAFSVTDAERAWAAEALRDAQPGNGPLVALHPGSGADTKNWLIERWAAVARELTTRHDARLVLTGGAGEVELVERIAADLSPRPLVLAGRTTLGQLAALFEQCALVLGGDSGPLHLAAAVGAPTVRLYGPTSQVVFGPWGDPTVQVGVQASLPCQPCGNIAAPPCGATVTPACLRVVGSEEVVAAALRVLRAAPSC